MKREPLHNKDAVELRTLLAQEQQNLAQARFDLADRKLKRTSDIGQARRRIARIMTRLAETAPAKRAALQTAK